MENIYYVYAYIDPRDNLPFYIGKGKGKRSHFHLTETHKNTKNWAKWRRIVEIKKLGLIPEVLIVEEKLSNDEAYKLEERLILEYGRIGIESSGILTNVTLGINPPVRKGKRPNDKRPKGDKHHMFGKTYFDFWVEKYGLEEANRLQRERSEKMSTSKKGVKINYTEEGKKNKSEKARALNLNRVWISKDSIKKNKHPKEEDVHEFLNDGWYIGKTLYNGYKKTLTEVRA